MVTVLGMGNALVDTMIQIENDQLLRRLGLPKGSMQLVDADKAAATPSLDWLHWVPIQPS